MTDRAKYFDYAATAPMLPEAAEAYAEAAGELYGNPSSPHDAGTAARRALLEARERICDCAGFDDGRLILTSGGTESNNLVIRGIMEQQPDRRLLVTEDTHPSIWFARQHYEERCDILRTGRDGVLTAEMVALALKPEHVMVCLSHACNETGLVHDVARIARLCNRREVLCHIDGTQALGHLPVNLAELTCDFYTFSAHKFGGPRGVGGVFLREGGISPQNRGGNQEWRLRAGTENVAGAIATAVALEISEARREREESRLRDLARQLYSGLEEALPEVLLNSDLENGLPGLVSVSLKGVSSHDVAVELNLRGYAVSTGSACHADQVLPSRVILSLGRKRDEALGTLRISLGPASTPEAITGLLRDLPEIVSAQKVPGQPARTSAMPF
jgi:cysteine desulfurase